MVVKQWEGWQHTPRSDHGLLFSSNELRAEEAKRQVSFWPSPKNTCHFPLYTPDAQTEKLYSHGPGQCSVVIM